MKNRKGARHYCAVLLPSLIVLVVCVVVIILYLKRPAVGIVYETATNTSLKTYNNIPFVGRLFSFSYSESLQQNEYIPEPSGIYLEKVTFTAREPIARHLTVSVRTNSDLSYTEIPDIKKRRLDPTLYTEEPVTVAGRAGLLFSRTTGGFEKTAFIPRNDGSVAALSLTSAELSRQNELLTEWQQLTASFVLR